MENKGNGVLGRVKDYVVYVDFPDEHIIVLEKGGEELRMAHTVQGIARFVQNAKELHFAWGRFQDDGDEVIYLYDKQDGNFGYAVNLDDPQCSEWGYAPFQ